MKISFLIGFAALGASTVCFYAEQKRLGGQGDSVWSSVERVLRAESRNLGPRLEEASLKADRDAVLAASRWKRKPPLRTYNSDTALAEPGSPKWLIVAGRHIRAAGLLENGELEEALERKFEAGARAERYTLFSGQGKYYLFVRGSLPGGQPYVSAYAPEAFFEAFSAGDGLRVWIADRTGTVMYHPLQRFIGSKAANIRPVSGGLQKLGEAKAEQFVQRYLGLEGREILGAWSVVPSLGLLVAAEWPRELQKVSVNSGWLWPGVILLGLAGFAFGIFWHARRDTPPGPVGPEESESMFDDAERAYLERARSATEDALRFAREQEQVAETARRERAGLSAEARHLQEKLALLQAFQEKVLPLSTGKQVWAELAKLVAERAPGLSIVNYRYSPSSFSLVPDSVSDSATLPGNALAYLRDTRIFLGNPQLLSQLEKTEGFARWNRSRLRQMEGQQTLFRIILTRRNLEAGALLVIFDESVNAGGQLDDHLRLLESMVHGVGTFCDRQTPLLQSSNAKTSAGPSLASTQNGAGNRPGSA